LTVVSGSSATYTIFAVGVEGYTGQIMVGPTSGTVLPGIHVSTTPAFSVGSAPAQQMVTVSVDPGFTPGPNSFGLTGSPAQADTGVLNYVPNMSQALTIVAPALTATCGGSPNPATVGQPVTFFASPSGGSGSYSYSWSNSVSGTGSTATFTPSAAQSYTANLTVTDTQSHSSVPTSCSVTAQNALSITTSAQLPPATIKAAYSVNLNASGGTPPYVWGAPADALPPGLTLSTISVSNVGVLSGTPTVAALADNFRMQVTDAKGTVVSQLFQLVISDPSVISPTSLPLGAASCAYPATTLSATNGFVPNNWIISSGTIPGLTLNSGSGVLSGTPVTTGTNLPITVQASDNDSNSLSQNYSVTIDGAITIASLPNAAVGTLYNQPLNASGGAGAPFTFSNLTGQPPGLNLVSGAVQGTPSSGSGGTYHLTVTATDSQSNACAIALSLTVSSIVITPNSLPNATTGYNYSVTLSAGGGTAPYTWSIAQGALPSWLSLNPSTGVLALNNGAHVTAGGPYNFTVQVNDSASHTGTMPYTLTVTPPSLKEYIRLGGRVIAIENH
jgi:hypothetical protein